MSAPSTVDTDVDTDLPAVDGTFRYMAHDSEPPVHHIDGAKTVQTVPGTYEEHTVKVYDGRPLKKKFKLEVNGFEFIDHDTKVKDFYDEAEVRGVYYPEVEEILKKTAGGKKIVVFDHTIRCSDEKIQAEKGLRYPVHGVHNDYTEESGKQRARDLLPVEEAEKAIENGFAIIQVWRPIAEIVEQEPLAVCDAQTLKVEDFKVVTRVYPDRTARTCHLCYVPGQRWYYLPKMRRNEAIVFKVFDNRDGVDVRHTAHSAFKDPTSPPDAAPRESIEIRALVLFDED